MSSRDVFIELLNERSSWNPERDQETERRSKKEGKRKKDVKKEKKGSKLLFMNQTVLVVGVYICMRVIQK